MRRASLLALAGAAALVLPAAAFAHGDGIAVDRLGSAWDAPPFVVAGAIVAAALYLQAFLRLRRRGRADLADWRRAALFLAGLAIGVLALSSPLDAIGEEYLLVAHMGQHVLIMDVAPLLVALSLRGPISFFVIPAPVLRPLGRFRPLRRFLHVLLKPAVAFGIWTAVLLAWHVPASYEATLSNKAIHDLEHTTFVIAGFLAWTELIDPARRRTLTRGGKIFFAIAMMVIAQTIIETMSFAGTAIYSTYRDQEVRLGGLSPLADQHWAAVLMFVEQLLTVGGFVVYTLWPKEPVKGPAREEPAEPALL
jgi:putative membrane protein